MRPRPGGFEALPGRATSRGNLVSHEPGDSAGLWRAAEARLGEAIEGAAAGFESRSALELEVGAHDAFARERTVVFGREGALESIARCLDDPGGKVPAVHGTSGSGKSAIMALASERALGRFPAA